MTAGAVLRVAGRVFLGWVPAMRTPTPRRATSRGKPGPDGGRTPWVMLAPVVSLLLLAVLSGLVSPLIPQIHAAARRFTDPAGYQAIVLDGVASPPTSAVQAAGAAGGGRVAMLWTASGGLDRALSRLFADRLPRSWRRAVLRLIRLILGPLRALHSGKVATTSPG